MEQVKKFGLSCSKGQRKEPVLESDWLSDDPRFEDETVGRIEWDEQKGFDWIVTDQQVGRLDFARRAAEFNHVEYYALGSKVSLHREFSKCAGSDQEIFRFAKKYGFLGTDITLVVLPDGSEVWGECLAQWHSESFYVRRLLELWELYVSNANSNKLAEYVFVEHDVVTFQTGIRGGRENIYSDIDIEFYFDLMPVTMKQETLMRSATRQLLASSLTLALNSYVGMSVEMFALPQLRVEANTLLGHIYLQLIGEVTGIQGPLTRCVQCDRWFRSEHKGTVYCSDACKMKAYRARKEKKNGK